MWLDDSRTIAILLLGLLFYIYLRSIYNYWIRHNVAQIPPTYGVGNIGQILCMKATSAKVIQDFYNHPIGRDKPFVGIYLFSQPALLIKDPELIKRLLIKDFPTFCDRFSNSDHVRDPLGSLNLFFLRNPKWKNIRFKLTPFFSSCRLKLMFNLVEEIGRNLDEHLLKIPLKNGSNHFELELKDLCALYTTDVIATVAFGIEANSFKNPNGDFRRNGREIFSFNFRRALSFCAIFFLPQLVPYLGAKVLTQKQTDFLRSAIQYAITERERSGKFRNDLIDILIEFKNSSRKEYAQMNIPGAAEDFVFEGDILYAQAAIFFTAGFESTSATMSFALYQLARNAAIQERLRKEIQQQLQQHNGEVTQSVIDSLEQMEMVIRETLRLYPPLPFLDRMCTEKAYSLKPYHDSCKILKGMAIYIPVYALHMDPKYYPNPTEFIPERFSAENRRNIPAYTYLPFGMGPHACIGERFALLQSKIGLFNFLRNHRVTLNSKTSANLQFDPKAIIIQAKGGIHLNIERDPLVY